MKRLNKMNRRTFLAGGALAIPVITSPSLIKSPKEDIEKTNESNSGKTSGCRIAYLKPIKIHEGCFSREKEVVITDYNGKRLSAFFGNDFIKNRRLEVEVWAEKNDGSLIFTPQEGFSDDEDFYGAMHHLWVKKSDLEYV